MGLISFEKSVGGVVYRIVDDNIFYLLVRYRSWQWDFPKGHMEKGENEDQTLRREIREETGIMDLDVLSGLRMSVRYFYVAKGNEKKERLENGKGIYIFKQAVYYATRTKTADVQIDFENKDFAWLTFDEAYGRLGNNGSKRIIKEVNERLLRENNA